MANGHSKNDVYTEIEVFFQGVSQSGNAVRLSDGRRMEWFPCSVVDLGKEPKDCVMGEKLTAVIPEKWAIEKGFENG